MCPDMGPMSQLSAVSGLRPMSPASWEEPYDEREGEQTQDRQGEYRPET